MTEHLALTVVNSQVIGNRHPKTAEQVETPTKISRTFIVAKNMNQIDKFYQLRKN